MTTEQEFRKTFWGKLHQKLTPFLKYPKSRKKSLAIRRRMMQSLLGEESSEEIRDEARLDAYSDYLRDLLYEYSEIEESLNRIRMSAAFISSFPFRRQKISKVKYLRYHYECYLNEVYIYQQRIARLLKLVERRCKQNALVQEERSTREVREEIGKAFKDISHVRGRHVHLRRYKSKKIEQLENLDLFSELDFLSHLKDHEFRILRKKLKEEILNVAETLEDILNQDIGEGLQKVIFVKLPAIYRAQGKRKRSRRPTSAD